MLLWCPHWSGFHHPQSQCVWRAILLKDKVQSHRWGRSEPSTESHSATHYLQLHHYNISHHHIFYTTGWKWTQTLIQFYIKAQTQETSIKSVTLALSNGGDCDSLHLGVSGLSQSVSDLGHLCIVWWQNGNVLLPHTAHWYQLTTNLNLRKNTFKQIWSSNCIMYNTLVRWCVKQKGD